MFFSKQKDQESEQRQAHMILLDIEVTTGAVDHKCASPEAHGQRRRHNLHFSDLLHTVYPFDEDETKVDPSWKISETHPLVDPARDRASNLLIGSVNRQGIPRTLQGMFTSVGYRLFTLGDCRKINRFLVILIEKPYMAILLSVVNT